MAEVGGGPRCSEPQSGERPDSWEAGHVHLKAGRVSAQAEGPH